MSLQSDQAQYPQKAGSVRQMGRLTSSRINAASTAIFTAQSPIPRLIVIFASANSVAMSQVYPRIAQPARGITSRGKTTPR